MMIEGWRIKTVYRRDAMAVVKDSPLGVQNRQMYFPERTCLLFVILSAVSAFSAVFFTLPANCQLDIGCSMLDAGDGVVRTGTSEERQNLPLIQTLSQII